MSRVKEVDGGPRGRPTVKDEAVRIFDVKTKRIYVYGGIPWRLNPDKNSPTTVASSSFHALNLLKMRWMDYSNAMHFSSVNHRRPFEFLGEHDPEELGASDLSADANLPRLLGASGLLVDDKVSMNRYILILGADMERGVMSLISINIISHRWSYLTLNGDAKKNIRLGAQIALSGVGTDAVYLHVFGGRTMDGRDVEDYIVADMRGKRWLPQINKMPKQILSLGRSPCALSIQEIPGHERKIILFRGRDDIFGASFMNAFTFDAGLEKFAVPNLGEFYPPQANSYVMHILPDSISKTINKWVHIGWQQSDESDNSAYEEINFDLRYKSTLDIAIWRLVAKLNADEIQPTSYSPTPIPSGSRLSEDHTSYVVKQTAKRSKPFNRKSEKSIETDEGTPIRDSSAEVETIPDNDPSEGVDIQHESSITLTWEKLSLGSVAYAISQLDEQFCVEYAVPLDADVTKQLSDKKSWEPSILLLGYLPKFSGEVKVHCYNAYAIIPLKRDDIEEPSDDEDISGPETMSDASCESTIRVTNGRIIRESSVDGDSGERASDEAQEEEVIATPSADTLVGSSSLEYLEKSLNDVDPIPHKNWERSNASPLDSAALHQSVENTELQHGPMYSATDYDGIVMGDPEDRDDSSVPQDSEFAYPS